MLAFSSIQLVARQFDSEDAEEILPRWFWLKLDLANSLLKSIC